MVYLYCRDGSSSSTYSSGGGSTLPPKYSHCVANPPATSLLKRSLVVAEEANLPYQTPFGSQSKPSYYASYPPRPNDYDQSARNQYQRSDNQYGKAPSLQSSRSSGSNCSSARDRHKDPPNGFERSRDPSQAGLQNQSSFLTSLYDEPYKNQREEEHYQEPRSISTNPHLAVKINENSGNQSNADSYDRSKTSLHTTSCDSGLPLEETEAQPADSAMPLLGKPVLRVQSKSSRSGTPQQFV